MQGCVVSSVQLLIIGHQSYKPYGVFCLLEAYDTCLIPVTVVVDSTVEIYMGAVPRY